MRFHSQPLIFLILSCSVLLFHCVQAADIFVDPVNGLNIPDTAGTYDDPFRSITYAMEFAEIQGLPEPLHFHLFPGTYDSDPAKPEIDRESWPIQMQPGMILTGSSVGASVLDGQFDSDNILISCTGVSGILVSNVSLLNNHGIALNISDSDVTILSCCFENNTGSSGAAISTSGGSSISINLTLFIANESSPGPGGAVAISGNVDGSIIDCRFSNNQTFTPTTGASVTSGGGAIHIGGVLNGNITGCEFSANTCYATSILSDGDGSATAYGGAVYVCRISPPPGCSSGMIP